MSLLWFYPQIHWDVWGKRWNLEWLLNFQLGLNHDTISYPNFPFLFRRKIRDFKKSLRRSINYWKLLLNRIFLLSGKNILWEMHHVAFPKEASTIFNLKKVISPNHIQSPFRKKAKQCVSIYSKENCSKWLCKKCSVALSNKRMSTCGPI